MGYTEQELSTKKNAVTSTKYLTSREIQERVLIIGGDLLSPDWMGWYCKGFKTLGESMFTAIVTMAKAGDNPKTLFPWLLKQELKKRANN